MRKLFEKHIRQPQFFRHMQTDMFKLRVESLAQFLIDFHAHFKCVINTLQILHRLCSNDILHPLPQLLIVLRDILSHKLGHLLNNLNLLTQKRIYPFHQFLTGLGFLLQPIHILRQPLPIQHEMLILDLLTLLQEYRILTTTTITIPLRTFKIPPVLPPHNLPIQKRPNPPSLLKRLLLTRDIIDDLFVHNAEDCHHVFCLCEDFLADEQIGVFELA